MNILFIYSRDIELNDSGGARTLIQLINFLSQKPDVKCYCLFRIEGIELPNVYFIPQVGNLEKQIHDCILNYGINILMTPEAVLLGEVASRAASGTNCKTVTALHNMPGYEKIGLHRLIIESLLFNVSYLKRIRDLVILLIFPLFKIYYEWSQKRLFRNAYNHNDIVVLLSDKFYDSFVKEYNIADGGKKLRAVGNGLSFDYFAPEEVIDSKRKQILVVSRFDERQKRISKAIKLWANMYKAFPDWKLVLVGFGRSEYYYKYLVKKLKVQNVIFTGKQAPKQYYIDSPIFLMTSDYEGWGMTITEAQQCGCVPVALNTYASLSDLITDGVDGYIVNSVNEMQKIVANLISDETRRKKNAINGVISSKRFMPANIYNEYYNIFKGITD